MNLNKKKDINQHDVHMGVHPNESNIRMPNSHKKSQTPLPIKRRGPIATSTKQMAGYFTVSGIQNEISLQEKDWPCFALKELLDNSYDWLNDYYPISSFDRTRRSIDRRIQIDQIPKDPDLTRIFRVTVRNSNIDQIEGFTAEGLQQIFDYTQWLSTKRNQHRMTAGSLGDYLKRHAGMAYASWNNIVRDSSNSNNEEEYIYDDDTQWEEPIIFRFNGKQYNVFVYYDRYNGLAPEVYNKICREIRRYRLY